MVITWRGNRPPACDRHGRLAEAPLPYLDAATLQMLDRRTVGQAAATLSP